MNQVKVITKAVEKNGRFIGNYSFCIEGYFGRKPESSIYYKIATDISNNLSNFEVGDKIVFSVEEEFDFWRRFQLKGFSSSGEEFFCFKWIVGREVLRAGSYRKSILSSEGQKESLSIESARDSGIFPDEKRPIILFNAIHREQDSYGNRPWISALLKNIEDVFSNIFYKRGYGASFFILDLGEIISNMPFSTAQEEHIRDYYVKHGYVVHDKNFLKKSFAHSSEADDITTVREDEDFFETIDCKENNLPPQKNDKKVPVEQDNHFHLFKWGDIVEIIDNGRDFLYSTMSNGVEEEIRAGMRGFVLSDEKRQDCGMITCSFRGIKHLYMRIHFSSLKRISKID